MAVVVGLQFIGGSPSGATRSMGAAGPFPFLDGLVLRPAACNAAETGHQDRLPIVSTMAS
jgi:hypothetical protein